MKRLNVTVQCMAVYNSSIEVPDDMTFEEAIKYANEHLDEIPCNELEYVPDSDILDEENCDFEENCSSERNEYKFKVKYEDSTGNGNLKDKEPAIKEEIENILRTMCAGTSYREWSEDMIDKLYKEVYYIIEADLESQDEDLGRLTVTEEMVVTAMMMYIENN